MVQSLLRHGAIIALWKASVRSLGEEMKMMKIKMNWPLLDLSASPQVKRRGSSTKQQLHGLTGKFIQKF